MSTAEILHAASRDFLRRFAGMLLTLLMVGLLATICREPFPALSLLLMLTVAFSTLSGGTAAGLASSAIAIAYCAYVYRAPGNGLHYSTTNLERLVVFGVALPVVIGPLGHLGKRIAASFARERDLRTKAESERERVENILESISDGFFALDRHWRYTYVNQQAEHLVGRTRKELLGKVVWDAFPPLVGSAWDIEYHRAVEQRVAVHFDAYYLPFDTWFETHAYPSRDGLTVYLRSINARKQAEALLCARARQQAAVASLGQHALRGGDLDGLMQAAVESIASTLDVEFVKVLESVRERQLLVLRAGVGWKPESEHCVAAQEQSQAGYTLASAEPVVVDDLRSETRFRGPRLLLDHGVVSGMSVIIAGGEQPFGILGAHSQRKRDFTQDDVNFLQAVANVLAEAVARQRKEEELAESELRFRQLANNVREVFYIIAFDPKRVLYISPAYETVWGRSRQSLYEDPDSWLEAIHPEDRERVRELRGPRATNFVDAEYRLVQRDGRVRFIRDRSSPVLTERGQVQRMVGIAEDITELREAADAEKQAAASTAALRARDEALAVVAHDLRNPLNSVVLAANLLAHAGVMEDKRIHYARGIIHNVDQAQRLIRDLLETARIESGHFTIEPQRLDVASVMSDVSDAFVPLAAEKAISLECSVADTALHVTADADRIQQALGNLLGNAIRLTPHGGRILVRAQATAEGVEFSVHDTGPGIAADALPRVFDRFWRAHPNDRKGLGLGLAIVKGIVDAHHGHVWAHSETGKGSSFHFVLPAHPHA